MRQVVMHAPGDVRVEDREDPEGPAAQRIFALDGPVTERVEARDE